MFTKIQKYTALLSMAVLLPLTGNAYEYRADESPFIIRGKVGGAMIDSQEQDFINGAAVPRAWEGNNFFEGNVSAELEADYFVSDRFSFGASLGYINQDSTTWTYTGNSREDTGRFNMIPVSANVKFHIAPYGEIRPYALAGYHYTFFANTFNYLEIENASGLLFGGGFDWWYDRDWGLNIEIKKYFMETEIDLAGLTGGSSDHTEIQIDPMVVSAGLTHRF